MTRHPSTLRLLLDPPLDGPVNMARDEALMTQVGTGQSPPTLRLYRWHPPTVSLGYFQKYADYEALPPPAGNLAVVRRLTGGGAILHDRELTYSLALPLGHGLPARGPNCLYETAHQAVIGACAALGLETHPSGQSDDSGAARGPFFCFARRHKYDVLLGHDKLAGSAQRRTRTAVLQHGSIVLENRFPQQPTARAISADPDRHRTAGPAAPHDKRAVPHDKPAAPLDKPAAPQDMPAAMSAADFDQLIAGYITEFTRQFATAAQIEIESDDWTAPELATAAALHAKYAGPDWTRRT